jgi:hypothetical protein
MRNADRKGGENEANMNWYLEAFSLDPGSELARYTFTHRDISGVETSEHVSVSVRVRDQESQTVASLRHLASQRLLQVLNELEMLLAG